MFTNAFPTSRPIGSACACRAMSPLSWMGAIPSNKCRVYPCLQGPRIPKDPRPPTRVSKTQALSPRMRQRKLAQKFDLPGTAGELFEPVSSANLFLARRLRRLGTRILNFASVPFLKQGNSHAKFKTENGFKNGEGRHFQICVPIS